ncbi:hypothetical protein K227x_59780 [Rubripirellula lacrimiformis]|uniref:Uncharacterized protein n=1 Tax=Rubripirellula lacrimiformis TaxID=1930273 RepID=A0A517NKA2_9BACT|nr:hypothetical protein K227x_59780 [Rubripirellula lacrimiformis]
MPECQVESAEGIEREPVAMVQLPMQGLTGDLGYPQSYLVDSFGRAGRLGLRPLYCH